MAESRQRSIAKAVSYRVFGSLVTTVIALVLVKEWDVAVGVGLADAVAKIAAYFVHERMWAHIKWGEPKRPDYEI